MIFGGNDITQIFKSRQRWGIEPGTSTRKPLRILRYPTGSIPTSFPIITCVRLPKWRRKCVRTLRNGAKVFGQRREFLAQYIYNYENE